MMKVCLGEGFLFGSLPFEEAVQKAKEIGYEYLETGLHLGGDSTDADIDAAKAVMDKYGVQAAAVGGGGALASLDPDARAGSIATIRRQIRTAHRVGCDVVTSEMSGGNTTELDACISAFKQSVDEMIPDLEATGVRLAFEPHPGDFIEDHHVGMDVLREIDNELVGYLYCCPHTFILGEDVAEMLEYAGDRLYWVHIADTYKEDKIVVSYAPEGYAQALGAPKYKGMNAHLHLPPGDGEVDFETVFATLKKMGYDGGVSAIPFERTHPYEVAKESYRLMQGYLAG